MDTVRRNTVIGITHRDFGKDYANTFETEPYCVKVFNGHWHTITVNDF